MVILKIQCHCYSCHKDSHPLIQWNFQSEYTRYLLIQIPWYYMNESNRKLYSVFLLKTGKPLNIQTNVLEVNYLLVVRVSKNISSRILTPREEGQHFYFINNLFINNICLSIIFSDFQVLVLSRSNYNAISTKHWGK